MGCHNIYIHVCMHIIMTKIISISDSAYKRLKKIKNENSFSEVIMGLTERPEKRLLDIVLSRPSDEDFAKNLEAAYKRRRTANIKKVNF
jgi:predicted CopG family antitoxin